MSQLYVIVSVISFSHYFTVNILMLLADFLRLPKQMPALQLENNHSYFHPNHYIMHPSFVFSFSSRNTLQTHITNAAETASGNKEESIYKTHHMYLQSRDFRITVHVEAGASTTPLKNPTEKIPLFEQFKLVLILPTSTKGHWVEDGIWRLYHGLLEYKKRRYGLGACNWIPAALQA
jgi:hypothetical protein